MLAVLAIWSNWGHIGWRSGLWYKILKKNPWGPSLQGLVKFDSRLSEKIFYCQSQVNLHISDENQQKLNWPQMS